MIRMNLITIIALILIFLGGIGAILLAIGQSRSSSQDKTEIISATKEENKYLREDLLELKEERRVLNEALSKRDITLQEKNDTIIKLQNQLTAKSDYIQNYLTGGNGFPFISFETFATDNFAEAKGLFKITLDSKFPLYSLEITIYDQDKIENGLKTVIFSKIPVITMADLAEAEVLRHHLDELSPNQPVYLNNKVPLKEGRYFIKILSRSNIYHQKVVCVLHDRIFHFAYEVYNSTGQLLIQQIEDNSIQEAHNKLLFQLNSIDPSLQYEIME